MSISETRSFLEDLLLQFDPDITLSEGSRAQSQIIEPILSRIGIDPFDTDIDTFVLERIRQAYPNLPISEETALNDTLIDPMRVLLEPIVREVKLIKLRSSLRNLDSLSEDEVDALLANYFETRIGGGYASGIVRVYFSSPQSITVSLAHPAMTRSGLRFFPARPQQVTAEQMILNTEGSEYYFDVNYVSERQGDEYNVDAREIVSIGNLPAATRVRNINRFRDGLPRETSLEFAARTEANTSDETLNTNPGIARVLTKAFPAIKGLFSVGFRDPEMQRDVIKGGSLGAIPDDHVDGAYSGAGSMLDDDNADSLTNLIYAADANFVSLVGAVGFEPTTRHITVAYGTTMVDVKVLRVVSSTILEIDTQLPVGTSVLWGLRSKTLTISDIPGGITQPDSVSGELEIADDEVHIGGRVDIYVSGETEAATALITRLTDESPVIRGAAAETDAGLTRVTTADTILLTDSNYDSSKVSAGMSLVLEEGADAGSYPITQVLETGVRVSEDMTGIQNNLAWKIVDEIDVELTDPKDIKASGSDMSVAAGNPNVTTLSAFNFLDATVAEDDVLRLSGHPSVDGDYNITSVGANTLSIDPTPPRSIPQISWQVFRRSEAVLTPVVRVSSLELVDSSGTPVGNIIPYRDPVAVQTQGFGNEGASLRYDGPAILGLVTGPSSGWGAAGGLTVDWSIQDSDRTWITLASGTVTISGATPAAVLSSFTSDASFTGEGGSAFAFTYEEEEYVGFSSSKGLLLFTSGSAMASSVLGIPAGSSSADIRATPGSERDLYQKGVTRGDAVSVVTGNNHGVAARLLTSPASSDERKSVLGTGPYGPIALTGLAGISGETRLYENVAMRPDVGARVLIGRPSIGSARAYFLDPTSVEFGPGSQLEVTLGTETLQYQPDPENIRVIVPAPPTETLPNTGTLVVAANTLYDEDTDFFRQGIRQGDLVDIIYTRIAASSALDASGTIAVGGRSLNVSLGDNPAVQINFPFDMSRSDVVEYINERTGYPIASLSSGVLILQSDTQAIRLTRDVLDATDLLVGDDILFLGTVAWTTIHPYAGTYIISSVDRNLLSMDSFTRGTMPASDVAYTHYRIRRYTQKVSSTEMRDNQDRTGMYYMDVELLSMVPGNQYNLPAGTTLTPSGHVSDGYRLRTDSSHLSYSRAEVLFAEISRTILLPGSSDSPEEYVQLSQQNIQVAYDRSQIVDEVQSYVDSDTVRVVCTEMLVRHLYPNYVNLTWQYMGGPSEPDGVRAITNLVDAVGSDELFEVDDVVQALRGRGATSVYVLDTESTTGRSTPTLVVVHHDTDRNVRAVIVDDFVDTNRARVFIPGDIEISRTAPNAIR